ncbi:hypothetical protein SLS62_008976 [Diatrype stigma]|uniref:Xylanolytic transcriptional activator regulatory domain-containing protein n=1 Tax=Diatrype stigma TaxID=117547 RepID=A0AAN9YME4_9PEZI
MADHDPPPISIPGAPILSSAPNNALGQRSVKRPRPVKSCCQKSQRACRYAADGDPANLSDGSDVESPGKVPKKSCMSAARSTTPRTNPENVSLSQSNTAVLEDHGARLERLERMLLANGGSYGSPDAGNAQPQRSSAEPLTLHGLTVREGIRTKFFGQMSTRVLLNLFEEAKEFMFSRNKPAEIRELFINIRKIHLTLQEENIKAITPIGVFVDSVTPIQKRMTDILPRKAVCDQLVHVYIRGTETIFRMVHIPTFMQQYNMYWEGHALPDVFMPQLLCILCVGYRFIGPGKGLAYDRAGIHIPTACTLVRTWLDGLRGKQLAEFSTLQCEILQLCAKRMVTPRNQDSWTHLGLIVRMAMTMGLHRDPSEFAQKISPFWAELRRRIWYTILEFDIQMSTQCNLPCSIRHGDFSCRPPRNLNDEDIWPDMTELPESKPIEQDTDCRIQAFCASTMPARFAVADLLSRIDTLRDYDQVLELGKELERAFDEVRYILPHTNPVDVKDKRRQWMTRVILDMHCRRPLLALYRPFALSSPDAPQQIMTGYLRSCMVLLSYLDEMDPTSPEYGHAWHLNHLVLKQDILQAAFSVCFYLKHASPIASSSPRSSPWSSSARSDSIEDACVIACESSILLSIPRLKRKLEEILDSIVRRIREIGTDTKDLVTLTVVLSTCVGGTAEQKTERIKRGLQAILEAGLQAVHINQENIASMPPPYSLNTPPIHSAAVMNQSPFVMSPDVSDMTPEDLLTWEADFWSPLFS